MAKQHVVLNENDRIALEKLLTKGSLKARTYKRVQSLLALNKGQSYVCVSDTVGMSNVSLSKLATKYKSQGLSCLEEAPRSGRPIEISGESRAKITALACSTAPEGHAKWGLRLLADKAVELGYVEHLSHNHAGVILKKMN